MMALRDDLNRGSRPWGRGQEDSPRGRLMETAARLMAEKGYAATSVREITRKAGCNLAAVNYYFGSKQGLYEKVFKEILRALREQRIQAVQQVVEEAAARRDVEAVLRAFAGAFLAPFFDDDRGQRIVRLFIWEMVDPHLPPRMFLDEMVEPMEEMMVEAMRRTCPGLKPRAAVRCLMSLVAQLVHVVQMWRLFDRAGSGKFRPEELQQWIEHIVRFSAAGVRASQEQEA